MLKLGRVLLIWAAWSICLAGVAAASGPMATYTIPEIKVFSLQERRVVAVAMEDRIPGKEIADVLGYRIVPAVEEKRSAGRLDVILSNVSLALRQIPDDSPLIIEDLGAGRVRLSLTGTEAAQTVVSIVHRKTVKAKDGMIRMRTYLVFNILRAPKKEIPTVVLDPGHGGEDSGAVKNFIFEKDVNLDISLRTARIFGNKGWNVVLTRRTDVEPSLLDRADAANIVGADVFISIHNNAMPDEKMPRIREYGTTVLYNSSAVQPAYDLAVITQDELVSTLGTQREAMQDRPKLVVLNSTWVPAILTEGMMLPNPANAKQILDRLQRERTAEAIVRATETWRGRKVMGAVKQTAGSATAAGSVAVAKPGTPGKPEQFLPSGNYNANGANRGTIGEKNGWIYYLRKADSPGGEREETLWRFQPDRLLSDQLLVDKEAWDINVSTDWLYFANWSDGQAIYRASLDGSNPVRIAEGPAQQISIAGEQLVFVRNRQIYTMPRDGGSAFLLNEDVAENVTAWGGWVYYANGADGFRPYRVKLDGTGRAKIVNDETLFMAVSGDWLFYSNLSDGEKMYRVKTDGTGRSKVTDERVGYLNPDNRFVYYTSTSQGNAVFRIRQDGGERVKVMDGSPAAGPIGIAGGKMYYQGLFKDLK